MPIEIYIEAIGDDDTEVLISCKDGKKAKEEDQSIEGSKWEVLENGDGYAVVMNRPDLLPDLKKEGYVILGVDFQTLSTLKEFSVEELSNERGIAVVQVKGIFSCGHKATWTMALDLPIKVGKLVFCDECENME